MFTNALALKLHSIPKKSDRTRGGRLLWAEAVETRRSLPSVTMMTAPSPAVESTLVPAFSNRFTVSGEGWPNGLEDPALATANLGRTARMKGGVLELLPP